MLQLKPTLARAGKIIKLWTAYSSQLLRTIPMLFQQHHIIRSDGIYTTIILWLKIFSNKESTIPSNNQSTEEALLGHTQFIHERNKPPCSPQLCIILKLLTFDTVVAKHIYVRVTRSAQYGFLPRSTGNGQVNRLRTKTIRHLSTCWRAVHAREWTSRGCFCLQTQLHRLPCCGLFACTCCRVV